MLLTTIQLGAAPQQHCYVAGHESSAQGMCMGTRTLQTQHAVELLGLPMDKVKSVLLDTAQCYPQTANVTFSIWPHRYRKHYSVSSREVTRCWVTGKNSERAECDNCSAFRRHQQSKKTVSSTPCNTTFHSSRLSRTFLAISVWRLSASTNLSAKSWALPGSSGK
jgi:hypothetical protein